TDAPDHTRGLGLRARALGPRRPVHRRGHQITAVVRAPPQAGLVRAPARRAEQAGRARAAEHLLGRDQATRVTQAVDVAVVLAPTRRAHHRRRRDRELAADRTATTRAG